MFGLLRCFLFITLILVGGLCGFTAVRAAGAPDLQLSREVDSLLRVLDGVIANRDLYLAAKEKRVEGLKKERGLLRSDREVFSKNEEIINEYESFVCDSAKAYLRENLAIAGRLRDSVLVGQSAIRLALIYSMCGQFVNARDLFDKVPYDGLPDHLKLLLGWSEIKFLDNMMRSTDEPQFREEYRRRKMQWRDTIIGMLGVDSDLYRKEVAMRHLETGNYQAALPVYLDIFNKQNPETHDYAMMAMGMSEIFDRLGDAGQRKKHLMLAAITDTRLAVKENEALLSLAEMLYAEGDIDRAYRYMHAALDDANFYNSRFKNSQIARVYPLVEVSYLEMLNAQQRRMRMYVVCMAVLALMLGLLALLSFKQRRAVQRSRDDLAKANGRLERATRKLAEANLIRERYVGYFMHQSSINVNRLDEFRKNVNRKIKANQIDDLYVLSSRPLEKELEELYSNFDNAFLSLYPNFIEEFNKLLQPESHFPVTKAKLNTSLRIFALIRLGITDMTQIANFLHYSVQTVYNYKSRVRKVSLLTPEVFEEKVKKIGTLAAAAE
mgnify:FL=1